MKRFLFTLCFFLLTAKVFGCSMIAFPTSSKFDSKQYIFIGEVVELIESVKYQSYYGSDRGKEGEGIGLKIKVTENVYTPQPDSYFLVFPLSLASDCDLFSNKEQVRRDYPIGSKVRVIAKRATIFKNLLDDNSIIRLETSVYNRGSIARNDVNENFRTTADTFYDYRSYVERKFITIEDQLIYSSNYYLPIFELQKDLARLEKAKSKAEVIEILERLIFYPRVGEIDFAQIAGTYLKDDKKLTSLEKQWRERKQVFKSGNQ